MPSATRAPQRPTAGRSTRWHPDPDDRLQPARPEQLDERQLQLLRQRGRRHLPLPARRRRLQRLQLAAELQRPRRGRPQLPGQGPRRGRQRERARELRLDGRFGCAANTDDRLEPARPEHLDECQLRLLRQRGRRQLPLPARRRRLQHLQLAAELQRPGRGRPQLPGQGSRCPRQRERLRELQLDGRHDWHRRRRRSTRARPTRAARRTRASASPTPRQASPSAASSTPAP